MAMNMCLGANVHDGVKNVKDGASVYSFWLGNSCYNRGRRIILTLLLKRCPAWKCCACFGSSRKPVCKILGHSV